MDFTAAHLITGNGGCQHPTAIQRQSLLYRNNSRYNSALGVLSTLPGNEYGFNEGTSMATPHVSGIAALILSKNGKPDLLNETLRQQIVTSVNDFYSLNPSAKGLFGSGYVDAAKALPSESEKAVAFHDNVLPAMDALRAAADDAETLCGEDYWPLPSYSKMLYYV